MPRITNGFLGRPRFWTNHSGDLLSETYKARVSDDKHGKMAKLVNPLTIVKQFIGRHENKYIIWIASNGIYSKSI